MKRIRFLPLFILLTFILFLLILFLGIFGGIFGGLGIDSHLFEPGSCNTPCWQGLTPGRSSSIDVSRSIDLLGKLGWPTKKILDYDVGCKWIRLEDRYGLGIVDFYLENDLLTFIQSSHPNKTNLSEIVNRLGNPQYFMAALAVGPDGTAYILEVYYPKQGLSFEISPSKADVGKLNSNMEVDTVQYYQPGDLLEYFIHRYSCFLGKDAAILKAQNQISSLVQLWSGFGDVKVIQTH